MGHFYFDESVHPRGGFVLGAFAYSEVALDIAIADALRSVGLKPGVDEFKSGYRMDREPEQVQVRDLLKSMVSSNCRIGLVVVPEPLRHTLGNEALKGLQKILATNQFESDSHEVFFDEGIYAERGATEIVATRIRNDHHCKLHFDQDSVLVMGLQLADLLAHTCATMLLAQLGFVKKLVRAGENSGYDPDSEGPIEFKLWAGIRFNFFAAGPPPVDTWKSQLDFRVDVESRGLHIADSCGSKLREAALSCFGQMYVGCIH